MPIYGMPEEQWETLYPGVPYPAGGTLTEAQKEGMARVAAGEVGTVTEEMIQGWLEQPAFTGTTTPAEEVTGLAGNVGYVVTRNSGVVYDPEAYARVVGKTPGELGLPGYSGKTGESPQLPGNFQSLSPREQFNVAREQGLIPAKAEFIPGKNGSWSYIKTTGFTAGKEEELPSYKELKTKSPELYKVLTTEGQEAYNKAVKQQQQEYQKQQQEYQAEKKQYDTALKAMDSFRDKNGNYDIIAALASPNITRSQLNLLFGESTVKQYQRLKQFTTKVSMSAQGWKPEMTKEEYVQMVKPSSMTDKEALKLVPYIGPHGEFDIVGAMKGGIDKLTIGKFMPGISRQDMKDAEWQVKYEKANWAGKMAMAAQKDPAGFAKELGISLIPIVGTKHYYEQAKEGGFTIGEKATLAGSIIADAAIFFIPVVGQVSAAVKTGSSIGEAVLRGTVESARATIVAPYTLLRHPVQSFKVLVSPIEVLASKLRQPLATFFKGSYSSGMDIGKVLAGETKAEALATRQAMEEYTRALISGEKTAGELPIEGFGKLKYSGTGLQRIMPDVAATSTPFGAEFKGLGVSVKGEGIFTAPDSYLGLAFQSATGKAPLYVFKGNELLGVLGDAGRVLDNNGREFATLADGTRILDTYGKTLGYFSKDGFVLGKEGQRIAKLVSGVAMTDEPALIGKYYNGQKEMVGKVLGTINKAGEIVDDTGKIIGKVKAKPIGWVPENSRVTGEGGVTIGKLKMQPAFVLVQTKGLRELPAYVKTAKSMEEVEAKAWQLFKSGKYGGDMYPVFKQYAKWIEAEGYLPPSTKMIPVVGENGKPVVLWTRAPNGRKIEAPMMQLVDKDWFNKSKELTRMLSGKAAQLKPAPLLPTIEKIRFLPKKAANPLIAWLRGNPESKVIGSTTESLYSRGKIIANDIDIVVPDSKMKQAAEEIADIIRKATKKQVRVTGKPSIEILEKGLWRKAVDIDPASWAKDIPSSNVEGVRVQTPKSQLDRLLARMEEEFGGKGYSRFYRFAKSIGGEPDLGIGAKPPTLEQLTRMTNRGIFNTVRDIFVRNLSKESRLRALEELAPDLKPEARQMLKTERELARLEGAARSRTAAIARSPALARAALRAPTKMLRTQARYQLEARALEVKLRARAGVLEEISRELPPRYSRENERLYRELLRETTYTPREERIIRTERVERPGRLEEAGRLSRTARAERGVRTERAQRAERVPRAERLQRVTRVERTERLRILRIPRIPRIPTPEIEQQRLLRLKMKAAEEEKRKEFAGATGWKQGFVIFAIKAPYKGREDVGVFHHKNPPPNFIMVKGGPESAFRSIQAITGKAPDELRIDLGMMDVLVRSPKRKPGDTGAISFKRDIEQKTTGDIIIGKGRPRVTKGETTTTVNLAPPIGRTKMPESVARAAGSFSAKIGPDGQPKIKIRRL